MKKAFKGGIESLTKTLNSNMDDWKTSTVRVAVIGVACAGKSSFINVMRGMKDPKQEGYAEVGINGCTTAVKEYPHPTHGNLVLCDLPGVGTPKFPKEKYLQAVKIDTYDFFIIITHTRFCENDAWLAYELSKRKKVVYFVKSKIDQDVRNEQHAYKKTEVETLRRIKEHLQEEVFKYTKQEISKTRVFLINNKNTREYDFETLTQKISEDLPAISRKAFV